jgi:glucose uptake protein GlcU
MFEGEGCGDPCGWIAAAIAALTYGSYGVPVKATLDIDVDPLVLQSYKTSVLFAMSWIVLLLGEEAKWTWHGIVAGFLWVSGGSFGILGIRNAGMAVAVGTWASVMVLINFLWGIVIFREPVNSLPRTCIAFGALMCGLIGMSKYSAVAKGPIQGSKSGRREIELGASVSSVSLASGNRSSRRRIDDEETVPMVASDDSDNDSISANLDDDDKSRPVYAHVMGVPHTQREFGILCSVLNGILAGSSLIPMHFAKAHGFFGRTFILSFGSGSLVANMVMWVIYFLHIHHNGSKGTTLRASYAMMPSLYLKELWFRGLMAGILLAIGMFSSILSISFLGQGVGNSLVQTKILISGLWGIFWFKEVKDGQAICKWFASAALCVSAILWLSYERNSAQKSG